jgi:glucose-1-phosphate cytidylyltransferase
VKVVLFCGGFGMRLREFSESIPKPMVNVGYRPILWHVMKYYAHFGHKDFILCLGWKANVIKEYFLNYEECISNDFVLSSGGDSVRLLNRDIQDWNITFVDTGSSANIGQRLKAVAPHLQGEQTFLANYADGVSDLDLDELANLHRQSQAVGTFASVRPSQSFHAVTTQSDGHVTDIEAIAKADVWMNGGYFVFDQDIFRYLNEGEELVEEPFARLIEQRKLVSLKHDGFWACMDTYKEKQLLDEMYLQGNPPWELWRHECQPPRREQSEGRAPLPEIPVLGTPSERFPSLLTS